mgnify:CR=1 FL=1
MRFAASIKPNYVVGDNTNNGGKKWKIRSWKDMTNP